MLPFHKNKGIKIPFLVEVPVDSHRLTKNPLARARSTTWRPERMLRNVRLRRLAGRRIIDGSNTERFREMPGNRRCSPGCASVPVLSLFSGSRLKSSNHLPPGYFSCRCLNSSLTTSRPRLTPVCINYTWLTQRYWVHDLWRLHHG